MNPLRNYRSPVVLVFYIAVLLVTASVSVITLWAAPPVTAYNPGETLTPTCGPSDTNCTVAVPWSASSSDIYSNFAGNVGIGTSSPYAKLSVVGEVVASRFTATSTATSTFAGGVRATCFSTDGTTCITGTGSSGISSLNGLSGGTQTFSTSSDTNLGLTIVSSGSAHVYTPTWSGTLAASRGGLGGNFSASTGWLSASAGSFTASTSPTVNWLVATSSTAFSLLPKVLSNNLSLGSDSGSPNLAITTDGVSDTRLDALGSLYVNAGDGQIQLIGENNSKGPSMFLGNGSYGWSMFYQNPSTSSPDPSLLDGQDGDGANGGDIYVRSGDALSGNKHGGYLYLNAGDGYGTDTGGNVEIYAGNSLQSGGTGGNLIIGGGNGSSASRNGAVSVRGGSNFGIGTTTPYAPLSVVGQAVASYFTATTTTASTLPYASSTAFTVSGTAYIGSLSGPLQANAGRVSATSSIGVLYGGTGLTSTPSLGNLLVGNSAGGYTLTATSSLNIALSDTVGTLSVAKGGTGLTSTPSYGQLLVGNASSGYTLTATSSLNIALSDTVGTLSAAKGGLGASFASGNGWLSVSGGTFTASTSPTVNYIIATSTTATSTFASGIKMGAIGFYPSSANDLLITGGNGGSLDLLQLGGLGSDDPALGFTPRLGGAGVPNIYAYQADDGGYINFITGGLAADFRATTTNTTITQANFTINADASGGGFTATLPAPDELQQGQLFLIKKSDATSNAITLADPVNGTIAQISKQNDLLLVQSDSQSANYNVILNTGNFGWLTRANTWSAQNVFSGSVGIGTTTPYAPLSVVGQAVASYFTATTTTASTLPYASSTAFTVSGTAYIGSLSGPLQANAGRVSATSSIGVLYGGTGLTSTPSLGNLLVGNSAGGYTLTATSSLNIALSDTVGTLSVAKGGTGLTSTPSYGQLLVGNASSGYTLTATSSLKIALSDTVGILSAAKGGTGLDLSTATGWLNVTGGTVTASTSPTINWFAATSTTATSSIAGGLNVLRVMGVGTTTPDSRAQLQVYGGQLVVGDPSTVAGDYFVAGTGNTRVRINSSGEVAADRFLDSANTSYYVDPRSGTNLAVNLAVTAAAAGDQLLTLNGHASQSGDYINIQKNSTTAGNVFTVEANGNVGVGTSTPIGTFSVGGTVFINGLSAAVNGDSAICISSGKEIRVNSSATTCSVSSRRFKHDINDLNAGLPTIMALQPRSFVYNGSTEPRVGLIAEEVVNVDPRLVFYEEDGTTLRGVRYEDLVPVLAKAMQEQQGQIEHLAQLLASGGGPGALTMPSGAISELVHAGSLVVDGIATFNSHIAVGSDIAGRVSVPVGSTETRVHFAQPYEYQPVVNLTLRSASRLGWYRVKDEDLNGFTVEIAEPQSQLVEFNWFAVGGVNLSPATTQDTPASGVVTPSAPTPNTSVPEPVASSTISVAGVEPVAPASVDAVVPPVTEAEVTDEAAPAPVIAPASDDENKPES